MPVRLDVLSDLTMPLFAVAGSMLALAVLYVVLRHLARRSQLVRSLVQRAHRPTQVLVFLVVTRATLPTSIDGAWREPIQRVLGVAIVAAVAWQVTALLLVLEDAALGRFRIDVENNLTARRIHTQVRVVRRVTVAVIAVLALAAMLMTFPQARAAGASVLASAGLVGVVAALAAQTTLGNVFAGLHLAFGDAIRLDDVVVVEGEWGRIEEITLSYVVVRIWDERRLILPSSYFTNNPFQNWTKTGSSILGTIEIDVDWSVPIEEMRAELRRIVESTDLWDQRVVNLQVIDATGGFIRVRALISAADSSAQWSLRCLVRERLVTWVQRHHPAARPHVRAELVATSGAGISPALPSQERSVTPARVS
ncbi:MAG: mechanosensitive ion channel [Micromonosporaceae bacterium]